MLNDAFGRKINYLRVSVTDRCNLRCLYCSSRDQFSWLPPEEILTYEELLRILKVGVSLGIKKIRLTGGEPLLRKGIVEFVARVARLEGVADLSLTTNGVLLKELATELKRAGLKRVNISLDTLQPERYTRLCGKPYLTRVLEGIETALKVGFYPVKLNAVIIRGQNDDEIEDLARLALEAPLEVRFIEFMPVGEGAPWKDEAYVSAEEIKDRLRAFGELKPCPSIGGGPAKTFTFPNARGKIGFITAMSDHFCKRCNRLRLTPEGKLRPCLFSDVEYNLKPLLRSRANEEALAQAFFKALSLKPASRLQGGSPRRLMRSIGG